MEERQYLLLGRTDPCDVDVTNALQLGANGGLTECLKRYFKERFDPMFYLLKNLFERSTLSFIRTLHCGGVVESPVRCRWMPGPERTYFAGGLVTHCNDEIHVRGIRFGELIPRLAAQIRQFVARLRDLLNCERIDLSGRMTAGAECPESTSPQRGEKRFRHHATRRVAGAEEEHVVCSLFSHGFLRQTPSTTTYISISPI